VQTYPNGNGEATWNLSDGTQGYVRSRGLDLEQLSRIVRDLRPHDGGASIPGFDFTPRGDEGTISMQAEHLNIGVRGGRATSRCQLGSTSFVYRIDALFGDPIYQYALVIDRPVPLDVGFADATLITISGQAEPTAPTVRDVIDAGADQSQTLLGVDPAMTLPTGGP
jgi:hypothetical protein